MMKVSLLLLFTFLNAQIALPTFQAVHKPHTAVASSLYDFTSHTFTNCGATGREGPTLANCKSSYDVSWEDDTDLFNVQTQGVQEWTAPTTGTYTIEVWGASGTDSGNSGSGDGGRGVKMKGSFSLTNGQILKIIVGQVGLEGSYESGGGGGSYVYSDASDSYPLIAAGGGGGGGVNLNGTDGQTGNSGSSGTGTDAGSGGSNGNGGTRNTRTGSSQYSAAAGAGWLTDGEDGWDSRNVAYMTYSGGHAPRNDGTGGDNGTPHNADGGFGGGGAARAYSWAGAGGGGGYSGGGAGASHYGGKGGGGGGGSYNSGSNQFDSSTLGYNTSDGKVIITIN